MIVRLPIVIRCRHADPAPCAAGHYGGRPSAGVCAQCPHREPLEPDASRPAVEWADAEPVCLASRNSWPAAAWLTMLDARLPIIHESMIFVPIEIFADAAKSRLNA